jgi:hypothetical protein
MGSGGGGCPSGGGSRRGGPGGHRRWLALASASQNSTTSRRRSVHQRSLPYWLPQALGALDHSPAARLDRGWQPAGGDLADHALCEQDLPTRLVVIAGVQRHDWLGAQRTHRTDGIQGRREQTVVAVVSRGRPRRQREAGFGGNRPLAALLCGGPWAASGGLPAAGGLGGAPVHRQVRQVQPNSWSSAASTTGRSRSATPAVIHFVAAAAAG